MKRSSAMRIPALFAVAVMLVSPAALAQSPERSATPASQAADDTILLVPGGTYTAISATVPMTPADFSFLDAAVQANRFAIRASRMALLKQTSTEAESLARTLLQDHRAMQEELEDFTMAYEVDMVEGLSSLQRRTLRSLSGTQGQEFRAGLIHAAIQGHQDLIDTYQAVEARWPDDRDHPLDQYARRHLPTLKAHLQSLRALADGQGEQASAD